MKQGGRRKREKEEEEFGGRERGRRIRERGGRVRRRGEEWSSYLHSPGTVQLPCSRLQPCLQIAGKEAQREKGLTIFTSSFIHRYVSTSVPPATD